MKIAIYARVSTEKQETENQLLQLREFASKQDWERGSMRRAWRVQAKNLGRRWCSTSRSAPVR
jgi:DNA invertase Pin-like site-specific DNA recombinase